VGQGHRVLDVATGIGEPALTAAGIVGAEGEIVGTDLSPRMIDVARQRAANQGIFNATVHVSDADLG
jgi:ubiquinone/menaquinone biosynthesis C-methylase UbiE